MLQVDAALQDAADYAADDLPGEIALKGRGSTDFRPGVEWLDEQGIRPTVCLYFTDMECSSYPEADPCFGGLWVNWGAPPSDRNRDPWASASTSPPDLISGYAGQCGRFSVAFNR